MFHILFHHFTDALIEACACHNRMDSIKRIHFNCHIDFRCLKLLCMQLILNISISSHLSSFHQFTQPSPATLYCCSERKAICCLCLVRMFEWDAPLPTINEPSPREFWIKWIFYDNKICMLRNVSTSSSLKYQALYFENLSIWLIQHVVAQIRYVASDQNDIVHCREQE